MKIMRLASLLLIMLSFTMGSVPAYAQVATEVEYQEKINALTRELEELQQKLKETQRSASGSNASSRSAEVVADNAPEGDSRLKIMYRLKRGASGEDVRILQKVLASDPTLYPEGLITGFFGPLTELAVKRFQAKIKLEQVGEVGPLTLARINEILTAAGITGEVPADLLNSRVKIEIKIKDGKEEVKIEIKCDSSGSGNACNDDDESDDEEEDENEDEEEEDDAEDDD